VFPASCNILADAVDKEPVIIGLNELNGANQGSVYLLSIPCDVNQVTSHLNYSCGQGQRGRPRNEANMDSIPIVYSNQ
jgi:hypothetical protein